MPTKRSCPIQTHTITDINLGYIHSRVFRSKYSDRGTTLKVEGGGGGGWTQSWGGGENTFFSVTLYNFQLKYRHKCIRIFNNDS